MVFFAGEPARKLQFMLQFLQTYPDFVMPASPARLR